MTEQVAAGLTVQAWFERDRKHLRLANIDDETVIELWDEAVDEAVADGFLVLPRIPNPRDGDFERCPATIESLAAMATRAGNICDGRIIWARDDGGRLVRPLAERRLRCRLVTADSRTCVHDSIYSADPERRGRFIVRLFYCIGDARRHATKAEIAGVHAEPVAASVRALSHSWADARHFE